MIIDFNKSGWAERAMKDFIRHLPQLRKQEPSIRYKHSTESSGNSATVTATMIKEDVENLPIYRKDETTKEEKDPWKAVSEWVGVP